MCKFVILRHASSVPMYQWYYWAGCHNSRLWSTPCTSQKVGQGISKIRVGCCVGVPPISWKGLVGLGPAGGAPHTGTPATLHPKAIWACRVVSPLPCNPLAWHGAPPCSPRHAHGCGIEFGTDLATEFDLGFGSGSPTGSSASSWCLASLVGSCTPSSPERRSDLRWGRLP